MISQARQRALQIASAAGFAFAVLLAACRSVPAPEAPLPTAPASAPSAAPAPPASAASRPSLAEEQRRLAALFRGTPVGFAMQRDGSLRANVPLRYCFDAGQFAVKRPLAAVLDQLAQSQEDGSSHIAVSASGDATNRRSRAALAQRERLANQRAESVRDYLVSQGIGDSRVTISAPKAGAVARAAVSLIVTENRQP